MSICANFEILINNQDFEYKPINDEDEDETVCLVPDVPTCRDEFRL